MPLDLFVKSYNRFPSGHLMAGGCIGFITAAAAHDFQLSPLFALGLVSASSAFLALDNHERRTVFHRRDAGLSEEMSLFSNTPQSPLNQLRPVSWAPTIAYALGGLLGLISQLALHSNFVFGGQSS